MVCINETMTTFIIISLTRTIISLKCMCIRPSANNKKEPGEKSILTSRRAPALRTMTARGRRLMPIHAVCVRVIEVKDLLLCKEKQVRVRVSYNMIVY